MAIYWDLIIILVFAIPFLIWMIFKSRKRREMLHEWAISQDLSFDYHKDHSVDEIYADFLCLKQGRSRYGFNHMRGTWQGMDFHAFDYHYVTGSGKHRQTHLFSAAVIESPMPLKDLLIRTEHFGDRIAEFFGADDIDFESIEFSEKYFVKASDMRWAFDVLHQRTIEFILGWPTYNVQFDRSHIIAYRNKLLDPIEFQEAADLIHGILERMPSYLTKSDPVIEKPKRGRLRL